MKVTADLILKILNDNASEYAQEDLSLDSLLIDIIDPDILIEALDFECGVTPPTNIIIDWTGRDLLEFYTT